MFFLIALQSPGGSVSVNCFLKLQQLLVVVVRGTVDVVCFSLHKSGEKHRAEG